MNIFGRKSDKCVGALLSLVVLLGVAPSIHAEPNFKIEDYKPVRLVDFEWRIDPSVNFSDRSPYARIYSNNNTPTGLSLGGSSRSLSSAVSTSLDYFNYNLSRTISIFTTQGISYGSNEYSSASYSFPSLVPVFSKRMSETERISLSSRLDARVDKYIASELFLSIHSLATIRLTDNDGQSEREWETASGSFQSLTSDRNENSRDTEDINFDISAGLGYGRKYIGRYSYLSWYVLNELENEQLVNSQLSLEEFQEMSEMLYKLKETHAVDSRIRRIDAVTRITDFLIDKGVINSSSLLSEAIVFDAWDFAPRDARMFGWTIKAETGFQFSQGKDTIYSVTFRRVDTDQLDSIGNIISSTVVFDTTETSRRSYRRSAAPFVNVNFEYLKPLSMRTHLTISSVAKYFFDRTDFTNSVLDNSRTVSQNSFRDRYDFRAVVGLNRIVNSRTRVDLALSFVQTSFRVMQEVNIFNSGGMQTDTNQTTDFEQTFAASGSMNYRIAIPTTLTVRARATYNNFDIEFQDLKYSESGMNYIINVNLTSYIY